MSSLILCCDFGIRRSTPIKAESSPIPIWFFEEIQPDLHQAVQFGFEEVCLLYLNKLNRLGKLGVVYPEIQTFKADKTKLGRSVEIDGYPKSRGICW